MGKKKRRCDLLEIGHIPKTCHDSAGIGYYLSKNKPCLIILLSLKTSKDILVDLRQGKEAPEYGITQPG